MNITSTAASNFQVQDSAGTAVPAADRQVGTTQAAKAEGEDTNATQDRITMSHGGSLLSRSENGKDAATQAIENSEYPDEIKRLMIKIRELQAQLREKAAELQKVAADHETPPRQREMMTTTIREAVSTITSAIRSATATLNDAMTVMRMSSDDRKQIATMISSF